MGANSRLEDPIPADALNPGSNFDISKWFPSHTQEKTRPTLDKVLEALKAEGVTSFAATVYCFGGTFADQEWC
jgi:dienelactone hydrolase